MASKDKPNYSEQTARYKAFMLLVGSLVVVLVGCTICLWFKKIDPSIYKEVLLILGIPTLMGMAFSAFFNENKKENEDGKKININADTVSTVSSDDNKS